MAMQVYLQALGCRLNEAELELWAQDFRRQGCELANSAEQADLLVINTCAVTSEAVRKSRRLLRQVQHHNPSAKLVVSGCFASLQPEQAAELGADLIVSNQNKERLAELSYAAFNLPNAPAIATVPAENTLFARQRSRGFIKVQDGCRYQCTFCIVTQARGAERSQSIAEIISQINQLHEQGIQEVILSGVHLGGYGSDLNTNLSQLISQVLIQTDIPRIRLGSLEPWGLDDEFFTLFANPRFMPHLHLPLQSGSDQILRRMARRCKRADFIHLIEQAHASIKDFNLSTDIIVGFPGETESDFRHTLKVVEQVACGHVHIFPYSIRTGTRAATMPNQVESTIKKQRVKILHQLTQQLKRATLQQYLGQSFEVLWESKHHNLPSGAIRRWGYTPNFLRVAVDTDQDLDLAHKIHSAQLQYINESGEYAHASLI